MRESSSLFMSVDNGSFPGGGENFAPGRQSNFRKLPTKLVSTISTQFEFPMWGTLITPYGGGSGLPRFLIDIL